MSVRELVTEWGNSQGEEIFHTIKIVCENDSSICHEILGEIKNQLLGNLNLLNLLIKLINCNNYSFNQFINETEFLSFLEKLINSNKNQKLIEFFNFLYSKFQSDFDIYTNIPLYHSRLVQQGIIQPAAQPPIIDEYVRNETEGQDPEEFKLEVQESLKLFDEIYSGLLKKDELSKREALISLASNLDRYSEQFSLWIEILEPGEYMDEAMRVNDRVTDALKRYKLYRSGAVRGAAESSSGDDSSSSDED
jgi:hypothetical protein